MITVLITGGSGMVGQNLVEHEEAACYRILVPTSSELDLTNFIATSAYLKANKPDIVIHAAGKVGGIQANIADPVRFLIDNMDMGRNIVLAARDAGIPRLINLGSSCMFPRDAPNPLTEEAVLTGQLEPTNEGYALAKVVTARLCEYVSRTHSGLSYKTLIPCNLFGRHDKFDPAVSHLVPSIIRKVHDAKNAGAGTVEVWGDGTARREFMYAGDLADLIWKCVSEFDSLPSTMNAGVGEDHTINDYYHTVAEVVGWNGKLIHDLSKPTGMEQKLVSIVRQGEFGWRPQTALTVGIQLTYDYFLSTLR